MSEEDKEEEFPGEPSTRSSAAPSVPIGQDPYVDYVQEKKEAEEAYSNYSRLPKYADDLQTAFALYQNSQEFKVGELVEWKSMMKNRTFPFYGVPAVVIAKLDKPTPDPDSPNDEITDLQIGYLDGEQVFRVSAVNGSRLKHWDGF